MEWKYSQKYPVCKAIVNKILCDMAAMAINNEESVGTLCFLLCTAIKHLFKPY
jgi:hypothetical protein